MINCIIIVGIDHQDKYDFDPAADIFGEKGTYYEVAGAFLGGCTYDINRAGFVSSVKLCQEERFISSVRKRRKPENPVTRSFRVSTFQGFRGGLLTQYLR